jgi:hypothetical protein
MTSALGPRGGTRKWRKLRELILKRDRFTCGYCGAPATTVDHIVSRAECKQRGIYADHPVNLIAACSDCNTSKGARFGDAPKKRAGLEAPFFNGGTAGHPHAVSSLSPEASNPQNGHYLVIPGSGGLDRDRAGLELSDPGPLGRGVTR